MTRDNLSKVDLNVKCTFAKIMLSSGYSRFFIDEIIKHQDLITAYSCLRGSDFDFGAAYQNVRFFKKEKESGIVTIENDGLSYRSFITLEDGSSMVSKSIYVRPNENGNGCYVSVRYLAEDQTLIEMNAVTKGKNNEIKGLCAHIYDAETIGKCKELNQSFDPAEIGEDIKSCMSPTITLVLLPANGIKDMDFLQSNLNCFSKTSEILTLSKSDKNGGKIPYEIFMNLNLLKNIFNKTNMGGNMEAKGTDLYEELRILEEIVHESERSITVDSLINKFSDQHSVIDVLMSFMGDLDLQPDLSDYGYTNYSVPVHLYQVGDPLVKVAEKVRLLKRTAAIIRLKDAMENHKAGMPLRAEHGKRYGLIRNDETGEIILDLFDKDHVQQGSIIIYKKTILIDKSYEPQLVVIRYSGDFKGEEGMFYEVVEDLASRGEIASLLIQAYDETTVLSPDMYDFSYMLPGKPIDENLIHICNIPYDKRDLVRGLSLGLHPERIAEIREEEHPIGSARKKTNALQN